MGEEGGGGGEVVKCGRGREKQGLKVCFLFYITIIVMSGTWREKKWIEDRGF